MEARLARTTDDGPHVDRERLEDVSRYIGHSLHAAASAQRAAARACNTALDTRRRTRLTVEESRRLRFEFQQARAARQQSGPVADGRPPAGVLAALQEAAYRLAVLAEAAGYTRPGGGGVAPAREVAAAPALRSTGEPLLTPRQLQILAMVAEGQSTESIAHELWLSVATVRNHVARTLRALDAHSRVEAIAKARRLGLL